MAAAGWRAVPAACLAERPFVILAGLVDPALLRALRAEAERARRGACDSRVAADEASEWRGGTPARAYLSAPGGPVQDAFYAADWLAEIVSRLLGRRCVPTASRGTFNYYVRCGDHLALHRDVDSCDVAVITCLRKRGPSGAGGGRLLLYCDSIHFPLSAARRPEAQPTPVDLREGDTLVMLGGAVPHRLLPLEPGQARIVSVLCFRLQ